ncbi:hypothetical protein CSOJ01_15306 [Colletotrichum sojae]|uniref:Uncharacterized protein n=1 Tax=Colletotrichum sojae TaxID=2175907 RepID=A0A8H6INI9_9PEZI|nr:hypothetical protein CSOJ01_15306 [Colletotrichum sojae]
MITILTMIVSPTISASSHTNPSADGCSRCVVSSERRCGSQQRWPGWRCCHFPGGRADRACVASGGLRGAQHVLVGDRAEDDSGGLRYCVPGIRPPSPPSVSPSVFLPISRSGLAGGDGKGGLTVAAGVRWTNWVDCDGVLGCDAPGWTCGQAGLQGARPAVWEFIREFIARSDNYRDLELPEIQKLLSKVGEDLFPCSGIWEEPIGPDDAVLRDGDPDWTWSGEMDENGRWWKGKVPAGEMRAAWVVEFGDKLRKAGGIEHYVGIGVGALGDAALERRTQQDVDEGAGRGSKRKVPTGTEEPAGEGSERRSPDVRPKRRRTEATSDWMAGVENDGVVFRAKIDLSCISRDHTIFSMRAFPELAAIVDDDFGAHDDLIGMLTQRTMVGLLCMLPIEVRWRAARGRLSDATDSLGTLLPPGLTTRGWAGGAGDGLTTYARLRRT